MFTYHYYAEVPNGSGVIDGVITTDDRIKTKADYDEIKRSIRTEFNVGLVVIKSLSLI